VHYSGDFGKTAGFDYGSVCRSSAAVILSGETEAAKEGRSTSVKDNFLGNNATIMTKAKITPIAISNRSTAAPIRRRAQFCSSPQQSFVISPGMQPSPDFIRIAGAASMSSSCSIASASHATHSTRTTGRRLSSLDHVANFIGP
jgi:hypothetical protein